MSPNTTTKEAIVEEFRIKSIQEAAIKVIGRKGVAGASMQDIAEEAGISKGTIYIYFENQQQLLRRTAEYIFARLKDRVFAAFEAPGSFEDKLRVILRVELEYFHEHEHFLRAYGAMTADEANCARTTKPLYEAYVQRFSKFLVEAMRKGEIRTADGRRLALFLTEGISAILILRTEEKSPPDIDEEVDWLVSVILDGVARKGSRK